MNQQANSAEQHEVKSHDKGVKIQIDRVHYDVDESTVTGTQLRHVPVPPIALDRDLFEVVPGASDRKIGENDTVELHNGKRFFTAPGQINPGSC